MKSQFVLFVAALFSLLLSAGCKPANESVEGSATNSPAQSSQDYAFSQKSEFVDKMNVEISKLKTQASELEAKAESCTGPTKDELKAKVEILRQKVEGLNQQLVKVKDANTNTWNEVKSALQKGTAEAKDSFNQARQWLSDKLKG